MKWVQHVPRMEVTEILHVLQVPNQFIMKAVEAQNSPVLRVKLMPCITGADG